METGFGKLEKNSKKLEDEIIIDSLNLEFQFASKVSEITGISKDSAIKTYTTVLGRLGLGSAASGDEDLCKEYFLYIQNSKNIAEDTLQFINLQKKESSKEKMFGPFVYGYNKHNHSITLHFRKIDESTVDLKNRYKRKLEMQELLRDVQVHYPHTKTIKASSWLLNVVKGFFPPEFFKNEEVEKDFFRTSRIWGQFASKTKFRHNEARLFLERVNKAQTMDDLQKAFPHQILKAEANISIFYNFYLHETS